VSLGYGPDGKRIRRKVGGRTKQASVTSRIVFFLPLACDRRPLAVPVAGTFISPSSRLGPSQVTIR
jgi:hypothetical protein